MNTLVAAVLLSAQNPAQTLLNDLFTRYENAKQLSASIRFTQTAAGKQLTVLTQMQYQWPKKLFIQQSQDNPRLTSLCVADGKYLSYDRPGLTLSARGERLAEAQGTTNVGEAYFIFSKSLLDRSAVLDILIARPSDIRDLKYQLVNGQVEELESGSKLISGDWRPTGKSPVTGRYQLLINSTKDIAAYQVTENVGLPNLGNVQIVSKWEAQVRFGELADPNRFTPK